MKKVRPYKWLRILANFFKTLRLLLRMPSNTLANYANACERLMNETTTQRMFRFVTYSPATAESTSSTHLHLESESQV